MSWWLAFWLSALTVCVLPFVPALREWVSRTDAEPLVVVRQQDTNIRHFAASFFDQVQDFFEREGIDPVAPPASFDGEFRPGQRFIFVGNEERPHWNEEQQRRRVVNALLIATGDLLVEGGYVYEQEIYCGGQLYAGSDATFRAVYAGTDLILGPRCTVARWLHSQGHVHIGEDSVIFGRVSSASSITLAEGTRFERLSAERIHFASDSPVKLPPHDVRPRTPWRAGDDARQIDAHTTLCPGNVEIGDSSSISGNLVAKGELHLGSNSRVAGNLKGQHRVVLGSGSIVRGSIVSEGTIVIGGGSVVKGPITSETEIVVEAGCMIGTPQLSTTATAPVIRVAPASAISGTLWASERGDVMRANDASR